MVNYVKWAKPDLSNLENDIYSNSIKSVSSQFISTTLGKFHAQREKVTEQILIKWSILGKIEDLDLSYIEKWHLEQFNQIQYWSVVPSFWKEHAKIEKKLLTSFWEMLKMQKFDLSTFKQHLELSEKLHTKTVTEVDDTDDGQVAIWKAPLPLVQRNYKFMFDSMDSNWIHHVMVEQLVMVIFSNELPFPVYQLVFVGNYLFSILYICCI